MEIKIDNNAVEKLVQEQIRFAVAEALNKNTQVLVSRIIDEALRQPGPNSYDREPQINKIVRGMIQDAAKEAVNEWLVTEKPAIKKLIRAKLESNSKGLVAQIAEQLAGQLGKGFDVSVWLNSKDR